MEMAVGLLETCIAPLSHAVSASVNRVLYSSDKRPVRKNFRWQILS